MQPVPPGRVRITWTATLTGDYTLTAPFSTLTGAGVDPASITVGGTEARSTLDAWLAEREDTDDGADAEHQYVQDREITTVDWPPGEEPDPPDTTQQHQPVTTVTAGPGEGDTEAEAALAQTASQAAARTYRDGIAVEIPTRAGLVTVEFTGRDRGRASPAVGGYTYRGRQYAGTILLSGPRWSGTAGLGWSLYPGGQAAGPSTAGTVTAIIAADVAAWLRDRPEILDQAAQARERAEQARARRDLALLEQEIAATRQQLDDLFRRRDRLQAIAFSADDDHASSSIWEYVRLEPQAAARFVVHTAQLRMNGEGTDSDGEPWVMENGDARDTVHSLIGDARSLLGWQPGTPPLDTDNYRTAAIQPDSGPGEEGGA